MTKIDLEDEKNKGGGKGSQRLGKGAKMLGVSEKIVMDWIIRLE